MLSPLTFDSNFNKFSDGKKKLETLLDPLERSKVENFKKENPLNAPGSKSKKILGLPKKYFYLIVLVLALAAIYFISKIEVVSKTLF